MPITWPIGSGKLFKGIYHLRENKIIVYDHAKKDNIKECNIIQGLDNPALDVLIGKYNAHHFRDEVELIKGASNTFDLTVYLKGKMRNYFLNHRFNSPTSKRSTLKNWFCANF